MARIRTALGVLAFCASTFAIACGDGERDKSGSLGVGGSTAIAGSSSVGGGTAGNTSTTVGGSTAGNSSSVGGGTAGNSSSVGGGTAGNTSTTVGGSTAGNSSSVGGGTAGNSSSVGGGTAGNTPTTVGGSTAGGTTSTAGTLTSPIGGATSTGGSIATGGVTATGGTTALSCVASFVTPTNNQQLANANDLNSNCSDGIQFNVSVATNAPNGTSATLSATSGSNVTTQIASTTVSGAVAQFNNAALPSTGQVSLAVAIGGTACIATETVVLNCAGAPACSISTPTINATTHPALNGVAVAQGGDMVSNPGSPYQVRFQIATDVADGQPVTLTVDGTVVYQGTATGGKTTFTGVTLTPDGTHSVNAACTANSGVVGSTGTITYPVDTTPPDLTALKGTGNGGATVDALTNGFHFSDTDDADPNTAGLQIKFCGITTATADSVDIPSGNPNANNFCVAVGGNSPVCTAAKASTSNGACLNIACPGSGPFDVSLSLKDAAGNPTTAVRTNLTCASTTPSVVFIDPLSDVWPFNDISKRILAADNKDASARRFDKNASSAGAQYDVVVCTSAAAGSTAILSTGIMGFSLIQGPTTSVIADPSNICGGNYSGVAIFSNATLPESQMDSNSYLIAATELQVTITDVNLASGSATADVWVDSNAPTISLVSPSGFCGSYFNTSGTDSSVASVDLTFASTAAVTVKVQSGYGTAPFPGGNPVSGRVVVTGVQLLDGSDSVTADAIKQSSNSASFGNCSVTVGYTPPPTVTWQTPLATSLLTASGNTNANTIQDTGTNTGWQGVLTVCTDIDPATISGATVTFTATVGTNTTTIGTANVVADGSCPSGYISSATLSTATVPNGVPTLLKATTSLVAGNSGVAGITVPVDTTAPGAPSGLGAIVKNRRQTSFTVSWLAPSDPTTGGVAGYKVRIAKSAITSLASFNAATDVPFTGTPSAPNGQDSIDILGQLIENNYYFAVAAVDVVGNQGPFVYTTAVTRASFVQLDVKAAIANQRFANVVDGTGDLNKDGFSDLIVNYNGGKEVDIFFGGSGGISSTPSVKIQGTVNQFGYAVAAIGDVNQDGYEDLAVGSAFDGNGKVYVYYGRTTTAWAAKSTLTASDANVTITADSTADSKFANSGLGTSFARLGDFNGDGVDDFAVGAYGYNSTTGIVAIVLGNADGLPSAISVPAAFGSIAIRVDGESTGNLFGLSVLGMGTFYGGTSNSTLVVGAPYVGTNKGRLYSFSGVTGSTSPILASSALHAVDGNAGDYIGAVGLNALGNIGPSSQSVLGISALYVAPSRIIGLSGTPVQGPFFAGASFTSTESTSNAYGRMVVGGGISGRPTSYSYIGSSRPDIVVSTHANNLPRLYIVDGYGITIPQNSTDIESIAAVTVTLNSTFSDFSRAVTGIPDLDGDGYGDLVVAETDYGGSPFTGHMLVLR